MLHCPVYIRYMQRISAPLLYGNGYYYYCIILLAITDYSWPLVYSQHMQCFQPKKPLTLHQLSTNSLEKRPHSHVQFLLEAFSDTTPFDGTMEHVFSTNNHYFLRMIQPSLLIHVIVWIRTPFH